MALPNLIDEPEETQPQTSTTRRIFLVALAISVLIVLITAIVWGPTVWYVIRERNPHLTTPPQAGGLTLDTSERGSRTANGIADALSVPIGFSHIVAGVYQDPANTERSVILMAGSVTLFHPEKDIDRLFAVITDNAGGVTDTRKIDAGPLGGEAQCGLTAIDAAQVPVCAWADHGSAGLMLMPGHSAQEAPERFRSLRAAVQKR